MKNKKILGMPFAVFLIGLVIIGGASAMLAGYLSNTATMNVEVESPMSIQFADVDYDSYADTPVGAINAVAGVSEEAWENDLNVPSTTGLGKVELGVKLEVADSVDENIEDKTLAVTLNNSRNDVTCADLSSLTFIDVGVSEGHAGYQEVQELAAMGLCEEVAGTVVYSIPINSLAPGEAYKYPVTMTFANVVPDVYTASAILLDATVE